MKDTDSEEEIREAFRCAPRICAGSACAWELVPSTCASSACIKWSLCVSACRLGLFLSFVTRYSMFSLTSLQCCYLLVIAWCYDVIMAMVTSWNSCRHLVFKTWQYLDHTCIWSIVVEIDVFGLAYHMPCPHCECLLHKITVVNKFMQSFLHFQSFAATLTGKSYVLPSTFWKTFWRHSIHFPPS